MLEAADQALVNDLTGAPTLKQRRALAKIITLLESMVFLSLQLV
jgi:LAO/AO transport system kinase